MSYRATTILVILLLATLPTVAIAADDVSEIVPTLEQVTVVGSAEDSLTVSEAISREQLSNLPNKNGSINEALSVLPGVQLGEYHRTSDNAGEIVPPDISISGGRTYQNNFTIDGFSNNSLLDPAYRDTDFLDNVPGYPQQNFIHPSLVNSITVLRSNIPAKYGDFTGGVVDLETRDPSETLGGEISFRHTRSEWTTLHQSSDRTEEYRNPIAGGVQPDFRKYDGTILLDIPINDRTGILISYTLLHSKIPLYQIEVPGNEVRERDQSRSIENFFFKMVSEISKATRWSLAATYSPYEAKHFKDEYVNGDYTLENFAYGLNSKLELSTDVAEIELGLGYNLVTNSREAPSSQFKWKVTDAKPWGAVTDAGAKNQYSKEGGFGDLEKRQQTISANVHVSFDPTGGESVQHSLSAGLGLEYVKSSEDRPEEQTSFTVAEKSEDVICDEGDIDCISGEQFMWYKSIRPKDSTDVRVNFYNAYIEDQINFGLITLRPGLRLSSDNIQDNTNLAPRFAASYDFFGDGKTNIYTGYNRYYGKTLVTHALREKKILSQAWKRPKDLIEDGERKNHPQDWEQQFASVIPATKLAELDTPYSNEITVGIDQSFYNGTLHINYLEREGKDLLSARTLDKDPGTGYKYSIWTNEGHSKHAEASISWDGEWHEHYLSIATTWQETETNNSNYTERAGYPDKDDDGNADPVWYRGSLVNREDLPRPDFNREWVAHLVYTTKLPYSVTFTNVTEYRSGYSALENTDEDKDLPSGLSYDIYDERKQPESWVFDWVFEWEKLISQSQSLSLKLEINNVFNEKVLAGNSDDTYELGRQFWLGMTYKF